MNLKIVAICPGGFTTGGPEALHQIVDMANKIDDGCSAICYMPDENDHEVPEAYTKYKTPIVKMADIPEDAVVVIPELWPYMVNHFKNKCALWWLSVDNFVCSDLDVLDKYKYHICQSFYAYDFVRRVYKKNPTMVTDYIDNKLYKENKKEKIVVVNPAKGAELIEAFESANQDLEIKRIQGMKSEEVAEVLSSSMLYIDFGHHPGKDRMPREAAMLDCVVMVKDIGAASFCEDVQIDDIYKFSDIQKASETAKLIIENYDEHYKNQEKYRNAVNSQKLIFQNEIIDFLNIINTKEKNYD
jgi:hypothetical protein